MYDKFSIGCYDIGMNEKQLPIAVNDCIHDLVNVIAS